LRAVSATFGSRISDHFITASRMESIKGTMRCSSFSYRQALKGTVMILSGVVSSSIRIASMRVVLPEPQEPKTPMANRGALSRTIRLRALE
jgi:hypothetical protein